MGKRRDIPSGVCIEHDQIGNRADRQAPRLSWQATGSG
jgi:hypothetical protein